MNTQIFLYVCMYVCLCYSVVLLLKRFNNVSVFINNNKKLYSRLVFALTIRIHIYTYRYACVCVSVRIYP